MGECFGVVRWLIPDKNEFVSVEKQQCL